MQIHSTSRSSAAIPPRSTAARSWKVFSPSDDEAAFNRFASTLFSPFHGLIAAEAHRAPRRSLVAHRMLHMIIHPTALIVVSLDERALCGFDHLKGSSSPQNTSAHQGAAANPYPLRSWGCADLLPAVDHQLPQFARSGWLSLTFGFSLRRRNILVARSPSPHLHEISRRTARDQQCFLRLTKLLSVTIAPSTYRGVKNLSSRT